MVAANSSSKKIANKALKWMSRYTHLYDQPPHPRTSETPQDAHPSRAPRDSPSARRKARFLAEPLDGLSTHPREPHPYNCARPAQTAMEAAMAQRAFRGRGAGGALIRQTRSSALAKPPSSIQFCASFAGLVAFGACLAGVICSCGAANKAETSTSRS